MHLKFPVLKPQTPSSWFSDMSPESHSGQCLLATPSELADVAEGDAGEVLVLPLSSAN